MALYFHAYREKWLGQFFVYSPDIFSVTSLEINETISNLEKLTGNVLMSQEFQGNNPEIFRYKIYRRDNWFIARMLFYQGLVVNAFSDNNQLNSTEK